MTTLSEMGITLIDSEDDQEENQDKQEVETENSEGSKELVASTSGTDNLDRTDDPVRMYLREMGTVELLSREGEISIAKRIEAGRELMIGGIYESPLAMRAFLKWRDEVDDGTMLLRDIIDLETTYARINGGANEPEVSNDNLKSDKSNQINPTLKIHEINVSNTNDDILDTLPSG